MTDHDEPDYKRRERELREHTIRVQRVIADGVDQDTQVHEWRLTGQPLPTDVYPPYSFTWRSLDCEWAEAACRDHLARINSGNHADAFRDAKITHRVVTYTPWEDET